MEGVFAGVVVVTTAATVVVQTLKSGQPLHSTDADFGFLSHKYAELCRARLNTSIYHAPTGVTEQGQPFSTWPLHVAWMYIWWVCTRAARKENPNPNPNSHITAYSVSGNVVCVRILICATRQKPCRKSELTFKTIMALVETVWLSTTCCRESRWCDVMWRFSVYFCSDRRYWMYCKVFTGVPRDCKSARLESRTHSAQLAGFTSRCFTHYA